MVMLPVVLQNIKRIDSFDDGSELYSANVELISGKNLSKTLNDIFFLEFPQPDNYVTLFGIENDSFNFSYSYDPKIDKSQKEFFKLIESISNIAQYNLLKAYAHERNFEKIQIHQITKNSELKSVIKFVGAFNNTVH